jgi:adenylylsulfate kinase
MLFIQMTGLSGSGKSTIALAAKGIIMKKGFKIEVIDGDQFRRTLFKELQYSPEHRHENIRRLAFICDLLTRNGVITLLAAINPYESIRKEIVERYSPVKTVWINCDLSILIDRDTKGLYSRALLPANNPLHLSNLTGLNDPYDMPQNADLIINTGEETVSDSTDRLVAFILSHIEAGGHPQ